MPLITDPYNKKHRIVALSRVYQDYTEIKLNVHNIYPFVDKIILLEGATADNIFAKNKHDSAKLHNLHDPKNKITIIDNQDWKSNYHMKKAMWNQAKVGDICCFFAADEYMSKESWRQVLQAFRNGATRVNVPFYNLWHDFNWRSKDPFKYFERFILKQNGMTLKNHYEFQPDNLKNRHMTTIDNPMVGMYHTCWTKPLDHLIRRSIFYYLRDIRMLPHTKQKLANPDVFLKSNFDNLHIYIGKFLNKSVDGYEKVNRGVLPEILKHHPRYSYTWDIKSEMYQKAKEIYVDSISKLPPSVDIRLYSTKAKPTMLILYKKRQRNPLASDFYERLSEPNPNIDIITLEQTDGKPIFQYVIDNLKGKIPNYIYQGFGKFYNPLFKQNSYIEQHGIKILLELADSQTFLVRSGPWKDITSHLVFHMPENWPGYGEIFNVFSSAQRISIPWGIDLAKYHNMNLDRTMDVGMICNVGVKWPFHKRRREFKEVALSLRGDNFIGNAYGIKYRDLLNKVKVAIVESSGRRALLQKYIEAAACGAMMIGDLPFGQGGKGSLLEPGVSFIEVNSGDELRTKAKQYVRYHKKRQAIAQSALNRVRKYHDLDMICKKFRGMVMKDWRMYE
jgi:glycosyltransferase involved in cell wall biosynthesis